MKNKITNRFWKWLASKLAPYLVNQSTITDARTLSTYSKGNLLPEDPAEIRKWTEDEIKEWNDMVKDTSGGIKKVIKEHRR